MIEFSVMFTTLKTNVDYIRKETQINITIKPNLNRK